MSLLAVVAELLKCDSEDQMVSRIDDLQLFRSYQMSSDGNNIATLGDVKSASYGVEVDSDSIEILGKMMWSWKSQYNGSFVPPYILGRIMTRLYSSLLNVGGKTVGDKMCIMVANFFNACIVEESRAILSFKDNRVINNNNLREDTKVFKNNLGKEEVISQLKFSKWIMSCPILYPFLDKDTKTSVQKYKSGDENNVDVYSLIQNIQYKNIGEVNDDNRPSFSGSKYGWVETKRILIEGGISEDNIIGNIIDEKDIKIAVKYIKSTNLFSRVYKSSVEQFIAQYKSSGNDA